MLKLYLSPLAERDLEDIFHYTFKNWGISQAELYQDILYQGMQDILQFPKIGKEYISNSNDYRYLQKGKHLLFYRINEVECILLRVLHQKMDPENHTK